VPNNNRTRRGAELPEVAPPNDHSDAREPDEIIGGENDVSQTPERDKTGLAWPTENELFLRPMFDRFSAPEEFMAGGIRETKARLIDGVLRLTASALWEGMRIREFRARLQSSMAPTLDSVLEMGLDNQTEYVKALNVVEKLTHEQVLKGGTFLANPGMSDEEIDKTLQGRRLHGVDGLPDPEQRELFRMMHTALVNSFEQWNSKKGEDAGSAKTTKKSVLKESKQKQKSKETKVKPEKPEKPEKPGKARVYRSRSKRRVLR